MTNNIVLNAHRGYRAKEDGFLRALIPSENTIKELNECRKIIRSCLKTGLRSFIDEYNPNGPNPKFRIQGSWAYGLCNLPAHKGQELDLDYGVYLSSEIFDECTEYSKETLKNYFLKVEDLLKELAIEQNWKLDTEDNVNCIRLLVNSFTHLDVPVYIVPRDMFDSLEEYSELQVGIRKSSSNIGLEDYNLSDSLAMDSHLLYENFRFESHGLLYEEKFKDHIDLENIKRITMAQRDGGYRESDCEQVRQWYLNFLSEQEDSGSQIRFLCRYLKAWRDYHWMEGGGPSSILLMVIACQNYNFIEGRDDLALLNILQSLPQSLKGPVFENAIPDHESEDFNRIKPEKRIYCSKKATEFLNLIKDGLSTTDKKYCLDYHIDAFGARYPNNEDYVVTTKLPFTEEDTFKQTLNSSQLAKVLPSVTSG
ncbi:cyclic GMP-AMP synthase DncV-like nucleotidyltransferase [Acinetobacter sp. ANC 4177]|uniref:CBASS cGAMP synthase n=1 Tax=Acinetobacter sp. ANC 4177 TaxID=2529838 RepID=UPI00103FBE69|nr:hypothetical protein [Acinetobacter sp. ANC 4177]TCB75663.1 hypothetical protein E0H91_04510 [Acinetobacter sp. ANC 4177]